MKKSFKILGVAVILTLIFTTGAQALFVCDACRPSTQGLCLNLECPGVPSHTTCQVYLANDCPVLLQTAEEQFFLSLEAQASEEAFSVEDLAPPAESSR